MNIGNVYNKQRDLPRAIEMYKQAIAIYEKHQFRHRDYAGAYFNLGIVYGKMKEHGLSAAAFRLCLPIFEQMGLPAEIKNASLGLARSLRLLGEKEELEIIIKKYRVKL